MKGPKDKKESRAGAFSLPGVDVEQLERLLAFMASHGLEEFEYEHGGTHIRLRKAAAFRESSVHSPAPSLRSVASPGVVAEPARPAGATAPPSAPSPQAEELHTVKSPIVGTFYTAAGPDVAPFVKPGDSVHVGQVVCIIEAMKLMNEIEADAAGKIVRVLVENGQPVEYGQELFAIRTEP